MPLLGRGVADGAMGLEQYAVGEHLLGGSFQGACALERFLRAAYGIGMTAVRQVQPRRMDQQVGEPVLGVGAAQRLQGGRQRHRIVLLGIAAERFRGVGIRFELQEIAH